MTETTDFNWADNEILFNSCGLSVVLRSANKKLWEETFEQTAYMPGSYSNMNIDFLMALQTGYGTKVYDLSCIIIWDSKPVGVWPLFLSVKDGSAELNFIDNCVVPPLFRKDSQPTIVKQLIKNCLHLANTFTGISGKTSWKSMESSNYSIGISAWHLQSMSSGAACSVNYELCIDIVPEMAAIKSRFRKSFKSLISSGQKLWSVSVMEGPNEKIWQEFKELHRKAAGRQTRSDETWQIHYQDILENRSFVVCLQNESGELIGAGLFNCTRDECVYAVAAYDRSLFDKPLGHVVQYRAIEEMKKTKISWYKLGPRAFGTQIPAPTDKEISIGEFKQGFASHVFPRYILQHPVMPVTNQTND